MYFVTKRMMNRTTYYLADDFTHAHGIYLKEKASMIACFGEVLRCDTRTVGDEEVETVSTYGNGTQELRVSIERPIETVHSYIQAHERAGQAYELVDFRENTIVFVQEGNV